MIDVNKQNNQKVKDDFENFRRSIEFSFASFAKKLNNSKPDKKTMEQLKELRDYTLGSINTIEAINLESKNVLLH